MQAHVQDIIQAWPAELQLEVSAYIENHGIPVQALLRVDLVLILLRIGSDPALERVAELTGKAITRCPSAMPPWPPKPVAARPGPLKLKRMKTPNPCSLNTDMARRYSLLEVGKTIDQLLARGVTRRDFRVWKGKGHIELA